MTIAPRVYLDTNVFIAAYENPGARSDHAWWLLDAAENGEIVAVTSELTLAEILVKPLAVGDGGLSDLYQSVLTTGDALEVVAIDRSTLVDAAARRAQRLSIKLPDALHLAAASRSGCKFFVTRDRELTTEDDGPKIVDLGPFSLDDIVSGGP